MPPQFLKLDLDDKNAPLLRPAPQFPATYMIGAAAISGGGKGNSDGNCASRHTAMIVVLATVPAG